MCRKFRGIPCVFNGIRTIFILQGIKKNSVRLRAGRILKLKCDTSKGLK